MTAAIPWPPALAGSPAVVVIEQADTGAASSLHPLLKELRFRGFVHVTFHGAGGRKWVIASRPDWLRRIV